MPNLGRVEACFESCRHICVGLCTYIKVYINKLRSLVKMNVNPLGKVPKMEFEESLHQLKAITQFLHNGCNGTIVDMESEACHLQTMWKDPLGRLYLVTLSQTMRERWDECTKYHSLVAFGVFQSLLHRLLSCARSAFFASPVHWACYMSVLEWYLRREFVEERKRASPLENARYDESWALSVPDFSDVAFVSSVRDTRSL